MYLLGLGLIFLGMKYFAMDPVAGWSWFIVLAPFALAVAWWSWADTSGYTKRKAMEKDEQRKRARMEKNRDALGVGAKKRR